MQTSLKAVCLLLLALLPAWSNAAAPERAAANAFERLSTLVGAWEGTFADGRRHSVTYRLTAAGTALVETWTLGSGRESMTVYHRDGEHLLADHYCPQGNAPRLQLAGIGAADRLSFEFRDGTNLQVEGKAHQHAFWISMQGANVFMRGETYVENGDTSVDGGQDEAVTYTRIAAP